MQAFSGNEMTKIYFYQKSNVYPTVLVQDERKRYLTCVKSVRKAEKMLFILILSDKFISEDPCKICGNVHLYRKVFGSGKIL